MQSYSQSEISSMEAVSTSSWALSSLSSSYSSSGDGDEELLYERSSSGEREDSGAKSFCEGGLLYKS